MVTCTSCNRIVVWARTTGDARMPVDPDPHPDGNIALIDGILGRKIAIVLTNDEITAVHSSEPARPLYRSHFVTCPHASKHRRRKGAATR